MLFLRSFYIFFLILILTTENIISFPFVPEINVRFNKFSRTFEKRHFLNYVRVKKFVYSGQHTHGVG